jgi:signal transduction histidine kinase
LLQWVLGKKWLPEIIFTAVAFATFPVIDFYIQGLNGLFLSLALCASVFFFRRLSFVAPLLIVGASVGNVLLGLAPLISSAVSAVTLFLVATFGKRLSSLLTLVAVAAGGFFEAWNATFNRPLSNVIYGVSIYNESGRWAAFGFAGVTVAGVVTVAWLAGAFWRENSMQRQASRQRDYITKLNLRTSLDSAELNERFSIARDLNELVMQRISAMLTISDGARYAAKVDASVAVRHLDRLAEMIRGVHDEMRRLFEMLNMSVAVAVAPPSLADLEDLATQYRAAGYPTRITHHGAVLQLIPSAELNIYRIVYDAMENVQKHAPLGTSIDVDLTWSQQGLQVLVKDNGIEFAAKAEGGVPQSYDQHEDLMALTQEITGHGIAAMRDRAQLFQGNVEARKVPGVGVTVNAIFPEVQAHLAEANQ